MGFGGVRGQERAVEFLRAAAASGRMAHAYLFVGPNGVGKGLTARTLAKALNCEKAPQLDSCDECASCVKIDKGIHPDVHWISPEGAGNVIKIEKIRQLKKNIYLKPFEGRMKFYIMEMAHKLNEEAANSLLKVLEEPPPDSVLILLSERPEDFFHTIKSRCQAVRFRAIAANRLAKLLRDEFNVPDDASRFLSLFSGGRIGRAFKLKDAGAIERKNRMINGFTQGDGSFDEESFISGAGREEFLEALDMLAGWYRDILILKNGGGQELVINADRLEEITRLSGQFGQEGLVGILEEIGKASQHLRQNVNPKLIFSSLKAGIIQKAAACMK